MKINKKANRKNKMGVNEHTWLVWWAIEPPNPPVAAALKFYRKKWLVLVLTHENTCDILFFTLSPP
jgi:hypothetical protein